MTPEQETMYVIKWMIASYIIAGIVFTVCVVYYAEINELLNCIGVAK